MGCVGLGLWSEDRKEELIMNWIIGCLSLTRPTLTEILKVKSPEHSLLRRRLNHLLVWLKQAVLSALVYTCGLLWLKGIVNPQVIWAVVSSWIVIGWHFSIHVLLVTGDCQRGPVVDTLDLWTSGPRFESGSMFKGVFHPFCSFPFVCSLAQYDLWCLKGR